MHASDIAHLRVAFCQGSHGQIMERACGNVTRDAPVLGSAGCQPAGLGSLPRPGNRVASEVVCQRCCRQGCRQLQAGSLCSPETRETPHTGGQAVRYPSGIAESAATCSCSADSRSRKYCTISSTKAASDRGKMKEYAGPFPSAGEIRRLSNKNRGS